MSPPVRWPLKTWFAPPRVWPGPVSRRADGVRAIYYEGPPYRGRPTRVFAYLGLPDVPGGRKVPGIVLLHGGGGTAFAAWVRMWNARGYAAIAMDQCGCLPETDTLQRRRSRFGAPISWGDFDNIRHPARDQWAYHAAAAAIRAHSLLRSLPQVDADRTGATGISWGGYLASVVSGLDDRLKFVIPVYGCGNLGVNSAWLEQFETMGQTQAARWLGWWDPAVYLPAAKMPMLWVNGTNDGAYAVDAHRMSYRLPKGPRTLCVIPRLAHGHMFDLRKEVFAFADSVVAGATPLASVVSVRRRGRKVTIGYDAPSPMASARLHFTRDSGKWIDCKWVGRPAKVRGRSRTVTAEIPPDAVRYFVNLTDRRRLTVST